MSLDWNATKVKNWQELQDDPSEAVCNETIIFTTMLIDMGQITEKNYKEFYARCSLYEKLHGARRNRLSKDGQLEYIYFTLDEIKRRIGLSTNVTTKTYKTFLKNVSECAYREALKDADYQDKKSQND